MDPTQAAVLLLTSLDGAQTSPLAGPDRLSGQAIRALVDMLLHGIAT